MMKLSFFMADNQDDLPDEAEVDESVCRCVKPDSQYLLMIEEGQAYLRHAACGKPPNWDDWSEFATMDEAIPVTAKWESNCTGHRGWAFDPCDCDYWVQITPAVDVPRETSEPS